MVEIELKEHKKIDIAYAMLETALSLYFDGKDYFSVIHLAGACDEIIGKYLSEEGKENSFESVKQDWIIFSEKIRGRTVSEKQAGDFINRVRNAVKHKNNEEDDIIVMDSKDEAEAMLERATENWWRLKSEQSDLMRKFYDEIHNL